ncbi:MAG: hypothetical protein IJ977_05615, partial [Fibrobacter sp.]|nr:hypothetical protein [Fibrobacter sp.]
LNKAALVAVGELPILEAMAQKAARETGIKGTVRLELTRDCDCDVNRFGKTYVVFLGTRLLTALTEEEVYGKISTPNLAVTLLMSVKGSIKILTMRFSLTKESKSVMAPSCKAKDTVPLLFFMEALAFFMLACKVRPAVVKYGT